MKFNEIKEKAKKCLKHNFWYSILVLGIFLLIMLLFYLLTYHRLYVFRVVGQILMIIFSSVISVLIADYSLSLVNYTNSRKIIDIFKKSKRIITILLTNILLSLIIMLFILVPMILVLGGVVRKIESWIASGNTLINGEILIELLGLNSWDYIKYYLIILLVLIFLSIKFIFVPYLLCSGDRLNCIECLKVSWELTKKNFFRIILFELSFIGWIFLGIITFGIGLLFVMPYINVSFAQLYKEICEEKGKTYALY